MSMNEQMKADIFFAIDGLKSEIVSAVSDLVRIPSVNPTFGWEPERTNGKETEVNSYSKKLMESIGIKTEMFAETDGRENLCGVYKSAGGGRSLLFNGHVDVVPPDETDNEPFSGKVDKEYIYGRGSVDMKGGNTAALFALKALLKAGYEPLGDVLFQHSVGEECKETEIGTGACLARGYRADAAIVCEPTCTDAVLYEVNPASCGVFEMKWKVKGKSCHSGMRREVIRDGGAGSVVGIDAIEKGMIIYNAIKELERQWGQTKSHPLYKAGNFCINSGTIRAGTGPSIVPGEMEMSYALFYPPQEMADDIKKEVETCVHNAIQNDSWLRENPPELSWLFNWPSFNTDTSEPICGIVQSAVREITPKGGTFNGFFAVCDASFLYNDNIPVVVMGPGENKYTHGAGERLSIVQLVDATKIYALAIAEWCGLKR
jgi:acetylornithine deacetylase